jgi:hypothetical protein
MLRIWRCQCGRGPSCLMLVVVGSFEESLAGKRIHAWWKPLEPSALMRHVYMFVSGTCPWQPLAWLWWCREYQMVDNTRWSHPLTFFLLKWNLVDLHISLRRPSLWAIVGHGHAPTCRRRLWRRPHPKLHGSTMLDAKRKPVVSDIRHH